jgi:hypothetical protein
MSNPSGKRTYGKAHTKDAASKSGGEGDRESDRLYREETEKFVNSARGKDAIKHAGDVTPSERQDIERAEARAKAHGKG